MTFITPDPPLDRCPECARGLVTEPGVANWCDGCDWNVDPNPVVEPKGLLARTRDRVGSQLVMALYEELKDRPGRKPHRSSSTYLALGQALFLHVLTIGLVVGPVWIAAATFPDPMILLLAAVLLAVAFLIRPRYGRLTRHDLVIRRDAAPTLYGLLDRIAAAAGAKPAQLVRLDEQFNASYGAIGLRHNRVVTIGLPLWRTLTPQQRVAVLAHEFGHEVNGDVRHLTLTTTALTTLRRAFHGSAGGPKPSPTNPLFWMIYGLTWSFKRLDCRTAQRAEYLADEIAARVAGPAAVKEALDVINIDAESVGQALGVSARRVGRAGLWAELDEHLHRLPERERERRRRLAARRALRVDVAHPPTHFRIERVARLPYQAASVVLGAGEAAAIERELAAAYDEIGRRIVSAANIAASSSN